MLARRDMGEGGVPPAEGSRRARVAGADRLGRREGDRVGSDRRRPSEAWRTVLLPDGPARRDLLARLAHLLDRFLDDAPGLPVAPKASAEEIRERLARYDFGVPRPLGAVLPECLALLRRGLLHTNHPRHFGLFTPAPAFPAALADLITAVLNPQLAVWSHAPAAVEIERHVIRHVGGLLGIPPDRVAGHFTSGGSEANGSALTLALTRAHPAFAEEGTRALPGAPVLYASVESHLAWSKIAQQGGLGRAALRLVPVDEDGRLAVPALAEAIAADRAAGRFPVMVVGTAGTTAGGIVDPLPAIADLAEAEGLHFHVDAAWAGAAAFSDRLRPILDGIGRAASVTLDAHKWLAMPMGAGMLLTVDGDGLRRAFAASASYMPPGRPGENPYAQSAQWSRRFVGLRLFLTLAALGRDGYARMVEAQAELGGRLRTGLAARGWSVVNRTPLPVACFVDARGAADPVAVARRVEAGGRAWLSTAGFLGRTVLRACVISHRSTGEDVEALLDALDAARRAVAGRASARAEVRA